MYVPLFYCLLWIRVSGAQKPLSMLKGRIDCLEGSVFAYFRHSGDYSCALANRRLKKPHLSRAGGPLDRGVSAAFIRCRGSSGEGAQRIYSGSFRTPTKLVSCWRSKGKERAFPLRWPDQIGCQLVIPGRCSLVFARIKMQWSEPVLSKPMMTLSCSLA